MASLEPTHASDPAEHIGREHAELERVFRFFETILDGIQAGHPPPRDELALIADYLTVFGDLRHHDKEESLLVPVLVRHGVDWSDGPLARMRREHRQERYFLRVLTELANPSKAWTGEDSRRLLSVGRDFIAFMRAHMQLENEQVLTLSRTRLTPDERAHLLEEFERFDAEHGSSTDYAEVRARIEPLLAQAVRSSSRPAALPAVHR